MINLLCESTYREYKGYTFIEQVFLNNNNKIIHCFVVVKNKKIDCLLQQYNDFSKEEKDKVINDYLDFKGVK